MITHSGGLVHHCSEELSYISFKDTSLLFSVFTMHQPCHGSSS